MNVALPALRTKMMDERIDSALYAKVLIKSEPMNLAMGSL